ncbi:MAG: helix-turn-helix domain-containing protein [Flavobacterium sp.]|nr:helix-turn-helix domain-containing protein [Flavobacterium sp.]
MARKNTLNVLGLKQFNADSSDFYVNTVSQHLKASHLHINKAHKHDFYASILFTAGSGIHEIDFNSYQVKPNSVFLLAPGQTHHWELSEDAEGIIFFHSKDFYESHYVRDLLSDYTFFSNVQNQGVLYLDQRMQEEIVPIFNKLLAVTHQDGFRQKQLLLSLITQIYVQLDNILISDTSVQPTRHDGYYSAFLKFQRMVEQHFLNEKSVSQYADWMNMTAKHLNRINQTIVSKSTLEIITDRVILEAKRILIFGDNNISQVAEQLGYSDYSHFSKIFKNKTGMTPTDFLKQYH